MFRVFPSRASSAAVYEALLDGILGFAALLAAAVTLSVFPGGLTGIVTDARAMAMAFGFRGGDGPAAIVCRHLPSSPGTDSADAAHQRGCGAGRLRHVSGLKQFDLHPHPGPLVGTAVAYFLLAILLLRGAAMALRGVTGVPRVLIVGTGVEAQGVLNDLRADDRHMREVVGFFATALDTETLVDGAPVFDRSSAR